MRSALRATPVRVIALLAPLALAPASAQDALSPRQEVKLLEPAAEAGDAESQYQLALRQLQGHGTSRDLESTARWLGRAADQGHTQARGLLDEVLAGRFARPGDADALVEIYRERANAGDGLASTKLGLSYRDGLGVDPDDAAALRWLEAGAEKGEVEAFAALGSMYDEGRGIERDRARAASWFRKAAERGHAGAQFALGSMVVQGDGIPKDVSEGLMWLELCRESEHSARYLLFRLEGELDPSQLAEGRARAAAWRSAHGLAPVSEPAPEPESAPAALEPEPL
jgi:TPR repeat protein